MTITNFYSDAGYEGRSKKKHPKYELCVASEDAVIERAFADYTQIKDIHDAEILAIDMAVTLAVNLRIASCTNPRGCYKTDPVIAKNVGDYRYAGCVCDHQNKINIHSDSAVVIKRIKTCFIPVDSKVKEITEKLYKLKSRNITFTWVSRRVNRAGLVLEGANPFDPEIIPTPYVEGSGDMMCQKCFNNGFKMVLVRGRLLARCMGCSRVYDAGALLGS